MSDSFTGQQINASIIRLTAAQWTAQPYVLPAGVIGLESDTGAFKIGDGETAWADLLAYSTPTGVKTYRALLTQTGTDAPVATVLENTLGGTVVWTRDDLGTYLGTLADAFTANKTALSVGTNTQSVGLSMTALRGSSSEVTIVTATFTPAGPSFDPADELLTGTPIEVLVYP